MPEQTVYKVVLRDGDKYLSAVMNLKATVEYKVGEFVYANMKLKEQGYLLTAFSTAKDARQFREENGGYSLVHFPKLRDSYHDLEVWRATASGVKIPFVNLPHMANLLFLEHDLVIQISGLIPLWPRGTIMVESLRLDKRIK